MSEEPPPDELFALLDDEYARAILTEASEQAMSAKALSEACDASLPTIYRRIDRLIECGLVEEYTRIGEEGRHYGVYEATLRRVTVELVEGELAVGVEVDEEDPADRFARLWEGVR
ncbi:winged helix-turn-helix domain-containing protein [Natronorarus salvus]|uniref:winged helix-turn-helix domain-containing protein n=1 Tax=Natronorarus salvus TaxID=3117733 RepID=UPI002F261E1B